MISRLVFLVALGGIFCQTIAETPNIAVNNLTSSGIDGGEAYSLANTLRTELSRTGLYQVMERSQMEEILKEQGFQQSGACDDQNCAIEIGKLLSVQSVVLGHVGKVGKTYTVSIRLVDVTTGKIQKDITEYHKGSVDNLLTVTMPMAAQKLAGTYKKSKKGVVIGVAAGTVALIAGGAFLIWGGPEPHPASNDNTDLNISWGE